MRKPATEARNQKLARTEAEELKKFLLDPRAFPFYVPTIKGARDSLKDAVLIGEGNPLPFYRALQLLGPWHVLHDHDTLLVLQVLWTHAREGNERAKQLLREVGAALAWVGAGKTPTLTPKQRQQKRQEANRQHQQDRRALKYLCKARGRFLAEIEALPLPDRKNRTRLLAVAETVALEEFSREGDAKETARTWYWKEVKACLADLTVS